MKVKIADIVVRERKREPTDDQILAKATSIEEVGLIYPITLRDGNVLVAGLTRLKAYELLELDEIEATMIEDMDDLLAEKIEIDENLQHTELTKLQESQQVLRRRQIWEEEKGKITRRPQSSKETSVKSTDVSFIEMMCRLLGKSEWMVYEIIRVAQDLDLGVQETIVGLPICWNRSELKRLAEFPDDVQREMAAQLKSGEITKVPQWDADVEPPEQDAPDVPWDEPDEPDEMEPAIPTPTPEQPEGDTKPPWNKSINIAVRGIRDEIKQQLDALDTYGGLLPEATKTTVLHWSRSITKTLSNLKELS